ncbi:MAG: ABC transporter permease [Bacteroidales bacterium]|nr:ABC transporter permease [Bacteroidales bacterium]
MGKIKQFFGRRSSWSIPYLIFMLFFIVLPLVLVVLYAFRDPQGNFTFENIRTFINERESVNTLIYSIGIALITTVICILLGYPAAYILSHSRFRSASVMVALFLIPMFINVLMRTLATVALFGFMKVPLGQATLIFGMVYNYLPFMILPIYTVLQKIDKSYSEAAQDLGASNREVFTKVTLPLSMPGVVSGIMMVFMPTISTFAIAELLTMNNIKLFGTIIQENINNGMWNYGALLSLIMLILIVVTNLFNDDKEEASAAGGLI